jgi:DNA-binding CsgD family transcriptional regulator
VQLESALPERNGSISRLISSRSPVLIFEVDAGGIAEEGAPARRCDLRLIESVRDKLPAHGERSSNGERSSDGELSAVLVLRALTPSRLLSCIRAVTRSGASMPPELLCQMLPAPPGELANSSNRQLTVRELTVLRMLADGEVTRTIAEQLNYSERTVKNIVRDVLVKLNCRTRAHAVGLATRHGVI